MNIDVKYKPEIITEQVSDGAYYNIDMLLKDY